MSDPIGQGGMYGDPPFAGAEDTGPEAYIPLRPTPERVERNLRMLSEAAERLNERDTADEDTDDG